MLTIVESSLSRSCRRVLIKDLEEVLQVGELARSEDNPGRLTFGEEAGNIAVYPFPTSGALAILVLRYPQMHPPTKLQINVQTHQVAAATLCYRLLHLHYTMQKSADKSLGFRICSFPQNAWDFSPPFRTSSTACFLQSKARPRK